MSEPKPLKVLEKSAVKSDKPYIYNRDNDTAIEVPLRIINTITKIHNLPNGINHIFVDVLATAINKRRLEDVSEHLEIWVTNAVRSYNYPQCNANKSFSKLIRTFVRELCAKEIPEKELEQLIFFFAKCPHGYNVTSLIRAHAELNPVIT
jgi:hypothetical protein